MEAMSTPLKAFGISCYRAADDHFLVFVEYYGLDAAGAEMEGQPHTKAPSIKLERRHREQVSTPTDLLV